MPVSRDTSNGPDWKDITRVAHELAELWGCRVEVKLRPLGSPRRPELLVMAEAWRQDHVNGEVTRLGCSSVSMQSGRCGSLAAAAFVALYELDRDIYRQTEGVQPETA